MLVAASCTVVSGLMEGLYVLPPQWGSLALHTLELVEFLRIDAYHPDRLVFVLFDLLLRFSFCVDAAAFYSHLYF